MARLLATPCTGSGQCPNLVLGGGPCPVHARGWRPLQRAQNHPRRIYDRVLWKRLRELVLAREPCCRECARAGRVTLARAVDHIVDVADGGAPWDASNLQPLCKSCHDRKTALKIARERTRGGR